MNLNEQIKQTIDRYNQSMVDLCADEFHVAPENVKASCSLDELKSTIFIAQKSEKQGLTNILTITIIYSEKDGTPSLVFGTCAYNAIVDEDGMVTGVVPSTAFMDLSAIETFKGKLHGVLMDGGDVAAQACKFEEGTEVSEAQQKS